MLSKIADFIKTHYHTVIATLSPAPFWVRAFLVASLFVSSLTVLFLGGLAYAIVYKQLRSFGPIQMVDGGLVVDKDAARKSLLAEKFNYRMSSNSYLYGSTDGAFCTKDFADTIQAAVPARYELRRSIDVQQRTAAFNVSDGATFYHVKCSLDGSIATATIARYEVGGDSPVGDVLDQALKNMTERTQMLVFPRNLKNFTYTVRFDQFTSNGRQLPCPEAIRTIFAVEPGYIYVEAILVLNQVTGHVYRYTNNRQDETYLHFRCIQQFDVTQIYASILGSLASTTTHTDHTYKRLLALVQPNTPRPYYTAANIEPHVHLKNTTFKSLAECIAATDKVLQKGYMTRPYNKRLVLGPRFNAQIECVESEPAKVHLLFAYGYFLNGAPSEDEMQRYEQEFMAKIDRPL